jgi:hypothetical protein
MSAQCVLCGRGPRSRRVIGWAVVVASLLLTSSASRAAAVGINVAADPVAPLTCQWVSHHTAGYLYTLQVGTGSALTPDLRVCNAGTTQPLNVVGVINTVAWGTSPTDSMNVAAYVSAANWQQLRLYLLSSSSTKLSFAFAAYAYDPLQLNYFEQFASGTALPAPAVTTTLAQPPSVSTTPFAGVSSPTLYAIQFVARPPLAATPATLPVRTSATLTRIYAWGLPLTGTVAPCVQPRLKKGLTQRAARRRLINRNCGIRIRHVHAGRAHRGRVVRVSGKPGKAYPAGHKVTVYIGA